MLSRHFKLCWALAGIGWLCGAQSATNDVASDISSWIYLIQRSIRFPIILVIFSFVKQLAVLRLLEVDRVLNQCHHDLTSAPWTSCIAHSYWKSLAWALRMRLLMLSITTELWDNNMWDPLTTLSHLMASVSFHNSLSKNFIYKPRFFINFWWESNMSVEVPSIWIVRMQFF